MSPKTVGFGKTSQNKRRGKDRLLECTTKWDYEYKTIHLPSKSLPKFKILIAFVNVLIDYNLMQNNSNVTPVTFKWHFFVGLYLGQVKTPSPCKFPPMCLEPEMKRSIPHSNSRRLRPSLTPPQFIVLAKSFPVPKGRMATGGGGLRRNWSRMESIQPTCSGRSAKKWLFQGWQASPTSQH